MRIKNDDGLGTCPVCGAEEWKFFKENNIPQVLEPEMFKITDSHYGITGELWKCANCGFIKCSDVDKPGEYYTALEDTEYVDTFEERILQAQGFLKVIQRYKPFGKLLDIGAGCGVLLQAATELGYSAVGIEPSASLCEVGVRRGLDIRQGVFPEVAPDRDFDIITITDVLEHVQAPDLLVREAAKYLRKDGVLFLTTPDSASFMARLLGRRWWHYRIAHICYFNRKNLATLLENAGLSILAMNRPVWHFKADYLVNRLKKYFPLPQALVNAEVWRKWTVPLNLFDSWYAIAARR
ncbi:MULTISPECIES: class I SAM-dependent methyltransferase [unclassified Desulfovibrio]|uniref:class I SAM-dependent methyltransferase n=1 Tax=unclassified Desulfovibrio TaxID=2593640 RepID=UPI0013EE146E|nr:MULTISPECIES: class I SAM-dependent methyltransferase [unclassified Desulfovibrio]